jgi:tetratricopeptide (TPR) repeat protein
MLRSLWVILFLICGLNPVWAQNQSGSSDPRLPGLIERYTKEISANPKDAGAYTNRGNIHSSMGNRDLAIADYTKAIEIDPKLAAAYYNRGNAYRAKGNTAATLADYNSAIAADPKFAPAYIGLGNLRVDAGDFDGAVAHYTAAIKVGADAPGAKDNRGLPVTTAVVTERAIYALAYHSRGQAYGAKGDFSRAIADQSKAMELDPHQPRYAYSLGVLRFAKGEFKSAATLLADNPKKKNDIGTALFLYLAQWRAGDVQAAEAALGARAGTLTDQPGLRAVAELYLGRGSPAAMLEAAATPYNRCQAQFFLGEWHLVKKEAEEAANAFKAALDTCPKMSSEYIVASAEVNQLKR